MQLGHLPQSFAKLQKILQQARIPSEWYPYFRYAFIDKIIVDKLSNSWHLHIHVPEEMPELIWQSFKEHIVRFFQHTHSINIKLHSDPDVTKSLMQKIWYWIQAQIHEKLGATSAGWLGKAFWSFENNKLEVCLSNKLMWEMAREQEIDNQVANYFKQLTGQELDIALTYNQNAQSPPPMNTDKKAPRPEYRPKNNATLLAKIEGNSCDIKSLQEKNEQKKSVIIVGEVFKSDWRKLKNELSLFILYIYDGTSSIICKYFTRNASDIETLSGIANNSRLKIRGALQNDNTNNELNLIIKEIEKLPASKTRQDTHPTKRVELHLHTSMSALDGLSDAKSLVSQAAAWGHPAIAITDHGVAQAFPDAYSAGKKNNIKVIFGLEANILDDDTPIINQPVKMLFTDATYIVFDIETTGLSVCHDHMTEIAAIKMKNGMILERFESFVQTSKTLDKRITELTGITQEMLEGAPHIEKVMNDFVNFIGETSILVAHNASFDMGFIQEILHRLGKARVNNPVIDTLELSRSLYPTLKNHRLNTLAQKLNVSLVQHHRAIYDAESTAYICWNMLTEVQREHNIDNLKDLNNCIKMRNSKRNRPFHVILLVQNSAGLNNLYKLISFSHLEYFYRTPRISRRKLLEHREGLLIGSGCAQGEFFDTVLLKSKEEALEVAKFYDYLELHPLDVYQPLLDSGVVRNRERLEEAQRLILEIGKQLNKPVIASANVHYINEEQAICRKIIQAGQPGRQQQEEKPVPSAHFRTTDEMIKAFSYLGEEIAEQIVVTNPNIISNMIERDIKPFPDGTFTPKLEGSDEELTKMCYKKAHELYGEKLPEIVEARLKRELSPIIKYKFSDLYLISQKIVKESLDNGYLVGSRGSVGSSLAATMSGITEVNPLPPHWRCAQCKKSEFITDGSYETGFDLPDKKCDNCSTVMIKDGQSIPFETFLGFEANKTPDIDLNFSSEYQPLAHEYIEKLLGKKSIFRAGTISKIQSKTAYGYVQKYLEQKEMQLPGAEIERLIQGCTGIKRTTGQHPGGLMVVPSDMDVHDFTPVQYPADDTKSETTTTHFDYHSLSGRLLKLDILGHQDPTIIRMLQDITGIDPLSIPFDDPKTMSLFSSTEALGENIQYITGQKVGTIGIPEFGTYFVRQMLEETRPTTFSELIRISGLSHGTDVWTGNTQELIKSKTCTLSEAICTRDDIMQYLMLKSVAADSAFNIMEKVRKGKGVSAEEEELMLEANVPQWYINSCRKILYMFPRAHAAAYVMMAVRIAWFKAHHPIAYYATYFYRLINDFDSSIVTKGLEHVQKVMKELQSKGNKATAKEKNLFTMLESVQEFYARGFKFKNVDIYKSHAKKFQIEDDALILPFLAVNGVGENAALAMLEAQQAAQEEGKRFLSIKDYQQRSKLKKSNIEALEKAGCFEGMPKDNQLSLFSPISI